MCAGWSRIFTTGVTIMGSHFQQSYYNGVAHILIFGVRQFFILAVSKRTRMFVDKLGSQKLHICPKVTEMGSKIGHRIGCNWVGALRGQRHIPSKN